MATINFYLKNADKKGYCPIMLTYQQRGGKFRYYTRLKVKPSTWKDQRVKSNCLGFSEINGILDDMENSLKEIEREAVFSKKEYSIEVIRRKFSLKLGELTHENDFLKVYDKFIEESTPIRAKGTIQNYKVTKKKLIRFSEAKKISLNFESIDQNFYEAFLNYMIKDLNHLNNTVGKQIKTLKVFLNYAVAHGYTNVVYDLKKFKAFKEDADIIYLTEEELMRIYKLENLPQRLINVRDSFCFACFTGLRFSDIYKLHNNHINDNYLEIRADKTKDNVKVPLNDFAKEILAKYKGLNIDKPLPKCLTNQKTNEYLKEIGQIAELNETISLEKFSGSKRIDITKYKYELIGTHTARKTFVTLGLEKGIRAEVVMSMTGHKDYRTFKRYIKITDKVMQNEMNRVWNKPLLKVV